MKALVTGGAGFIGSHLVDRLLRDGHDVVVVDDLSTGSVANLADAWNHPGLSFIERDVTAPGAIGEMAGLGADVVFHLAAQMDVRHSVADPLDDARRNVLGTISVLEAARRGGVRKVVLASSGGAIYGEQETRPTPEDVTPDPAAQYAASKICAETYLDVYRNLYQLETTALRLGNVFGPRQNPEGEAGVVVIFAGAMLAGRPTYWFGNGETTRDYVHVDDVVEAFVRSAARVADGARLNIGSGRETTIAELHQLVAAATGCDQGPVIQPARPGELDRVCLDIRAAHRALGWQPQVEIENGIAGTVAWLRDSLVPAGGDGQGGVS
jgi:UDP-glucose 4-epimerase